MKKLITILLCLIVINSFSQIKVKKVVEKNETWRYTEIYYVKKKSKNIKHGEYIKTHITGEILERGNYSHGMKVGLWEKYSTRGYLLDRGEYKNSKKKGIWEKYSLHQKDTLLNKGKFDYGSKIGEWIYNDYKGHFKYKFDYDSNELIEYSWLDDPQIFRIRDNESNWIKIKIDPPPIPIETDIDSYKRDNFHYPHEAIKKGITGKVIIAIIIDKKGDTISYRIHKSVHKILDDECMKLVKSIKGWYPAKLNHEKVECEYLIPFSFKINYGKS